MKWYVNKNRLFSEKVKLETNLQIITEIKLGQQTFLFDISVCFRPVQTTLAMKAWWPMMLLTCSSSISGNYQSLYSPPRCQRHSSLSSQVSSKFSSPSHHKRELHPKPNWFVCYLKIVNTIWKIRCIVKQIVWETIKRHWISAVLQELLDLFEF